MEFLDFLFFAVITFYIIRSLIRIVMPMLFQNVINKAQQQQNYNSKAKPGNIKVEYMPKPKSTVPDSEGEFVDYEEIK